MNPDLAWRTAGLALLSTLALASPALASNEDPCATQADARQITACLKQQLDEQDRKLNAAYQKLMRTLAKAGDGAAKGEGPRELLVIAQRHWIEFRDADCAALRQIFAGGSGATAAQLACLRERTEQRIRQLDTQAWTGG